MGVKRFMFWGELSVSSTPHPVGCTHDLYQRLLKGEPEDNSTYETGYATRYDYNRSVFSFHFFSK